MNKQFILFLFSFLFLITSCDPNEFKGNVSRKSKFTKGTVVYYGDIRNIGTNVLSLDIYSSKLSLDSTGANYVGIGKNLYFDDLYISSAEHKLVDGIYKADSTGNAFTFLPGKNNDGVSSGAYLATVSDMQISYDYITLGQFVVQTKNDSTIIDFELKTDRGDKFEAQFRGILAWYDMLPELTQGKQEYRRGLYNKSTDNIQIALGSVGMDLNNSFLSTSGEEMILEFNVDTLTNGVLRSGRYTVASQPQASEDFANFSANTITPYFSVKNEKGEILHCGSWLTSYTKQLSYGVVNGHADVSTDGEIYTINYDFNSDTDYEVKGTYVGEIPSMRIKENETVAKRSRDAKQTIDYVLPQG